METVGVLTELVLSLGGPPVSYVDLARVSDMTAGQALIQWMLAQAQELNEGSETRISRGALKRIALEHEELRFTERLRDVGCTSCIETASSTPSSLRGQVGSTQAEYMLLENQLHMLRARFEQINVVTQRLKKTAKTLKSTIFGAESEIQSLCRHLNDLSLSCDVTIQTVASAVPSSLELLSAFSDQRSSLSLEQMSAYHDVMSSRAQERQKYIIDQEELALSPENVAYEAARLQQALSHLYDNSNALTEQAYKEGLLEICKEIDDANSLQDLDLLTGVLDCSENIDADARPAGPDIKAEIERAWMLDRHELLQAGEELAEQVHGLLDSHLSCQLQALHEALLSRTEKTFEMECLVNVLLEELEAIAEDTEDARTRSVAKDAHSAEAEAILQNELIKSLKRLQDFRPANEPPLVLLDNTDLGEELLAVKRRADASTREHDVWLSSLASHVTSLSQSNEPLLSAIYENAPLNTSVPFALGPELKYLEDETRNRAKTMSDAIVRFEKDVKFNNHTRRKLNAFVEKWGRDRT